MAGYAPNRMKTAWPDPSVPLLVTATRSVDTQRYAGISDAIAMAISHGDSTHLRGPGKKQEQQGPAQRGPAVGKHVCACGEAPDAQWPMPETAL
eukprot:2230567-Alexandrium_andersonii.AAC.1